MIYYHIYPSTYEVLVQKILPEHVSAQKQDGNNDQDR